MLNRLRAIGQKASEPLGQIARKRTYSRTRWINYFEDLRWNCLRLHQSEMMEVMEDREVWRLNLELLLRNSLRKAGNEKGEKPKTTKIGFIPLPYSDQAKFFD